MAFPQTDFNRWALNIAPDGSELPGGHGLFLPMGWAGVLAALPFAVWLYLAVEETPLAVEESVDPVRDLPRGIVLAIATLILTAFLIAAINPAVKGVDLRFAKGLMSAVQKPPRPELASIVARNLVRGFHRRIPFGQVLAARCGEEPIKAEILSTAMPNGLAEDHLNPDTESALAKRMEIARYTPAWLYFLCEAKLSGGERLGPTASRIIAETFVDLMKLKGAEISGDGGRPWRPEDSPMRNAARKPIASLRDLLLFAVGQA